MTNFVQKVYWHEITGVSLNELSEHKRTFFIIWNYFHVFTSNTRVENPHFWQKQPKINWKLVNMNILRYFWSKMVFWSVKKIRKFEKNKEIWLEFLSKLPKNEFYGQADSKNQKIQNNCIPKWVFYGIFLQKYNEFGWKFSKF